MKKIILLATTLCLLLVMLVGCDAENYPNGDGLSFRATILEIHDAYVLVKTIEGMGFHHVTRVVFGTRELEDIGASVGDVVNVSFTGDILYTYPEEIFATSWSLVSRHGDGIEPIPHAGAAHETHRIVNAMPLPRSYMPLRSIQIGADHGGFGYGAYTLTIHYDFNGNILDYIPGEAFEQIATSLFNHIENLEAVTFSLVNTEETDTDNYICRWSISRTSSDVGGGAVTSFRGVQSTSLDNSLLPPEFIGLPVVNHCLPQENPMASRMGVGSLLDILGTPGRAVQFWDANPVQAFAFVRVVETAQDNDILTSVVEVLRTVWSRERELPEVMTLVQHSGAIMCCSPYGEMMREGGVFLLPLWYNDGSMQGWREGWFNWTYRDVLFEIDDNGLVWSRSNLSAFNRFDGRHTSVLTGAILGIANGDENLGRDVAHTWFGGAADDGVLAIVTITSYESLLLFPTGQELWSLSYTMRINEIFSTPTSYGLQRGGWFDTQQRWRENWQVSEQWWDDWENNPEISLTETSFSQGVLNVGEQFLVFIAPSFSDWNSPFTFNGNAARINADGTITPVSGEGNIWNVFDEFDGYTVERLAELASLANTWHEEYVEP